MITKQGAIKVLNWLCGGGNNSPMLFAALSSTQPSIDGSNVTEPSAATYVTSYSRVRLTSSTNDRGQYAFSGSSAVATEKGAKISSKYIAYFPETYNPNTDTIEDWGELRYICIFDAATGGNLIAYQALPEVIHPGAQGVSTIPIIRVGDITMEISNP